MFLLDYWYVIIPGVLLGLYAQIKLSMVYRKYVRIGTEYGMTGAQAARQILDRAGLGAMPVHEVRGHLTDHYDPIKKALFLSSENFRGNSVAAVGVAAHEAGHALQHQAAYAPLKWRMAMVPVTNFASMAYMGIIVLGLILGNFTQFLGIVIGIFTVIAVFQIITLPVEFDASRRAKERLLSYGLITAREGPAVGKVLNAAALTYVAAMVTSLLQLLQFVMIARDRD
jgi:Zn-dependent membrane protease YugP